MAWPLIWTSVFLSLFQIFIVFGLRHVPENLIQDILVSTIDGSSSQFSNHKRPDSLSSFNEFQLFGEWNHSKTDLHKIPKKNYPVLNDRLKRETSKESTETNEETENKNKEKEDKNKTNETEQDKENEREKRGTSKESKEKSTETIEGKENNNKKEKEGDNENKSTQTEIERVKRGANKESDESSTEAKEEKENNQEGEGAKASKETEEETEKERENERRKRETRKQSDESSTEAKEEQENDNQEEEEGKKESKETEEERENERVKRETSKEDKSKESEESKETKSEKSGDQEESKSEGSEEKTVKKSGQDYTDGGKEKEEEKEEEEEKEGKHTNKGSSAENNEEKKERHNTDEKKKGKEEMKESHKPNKNNKETKAMDEPNEKKKEKEDMKENDNEENKRTKTEKKDFENNKKEKEKKNEKDEHSKELKTKGGGENIEDIQKNVIKYLGRARQTGRIGDFSDFATNVADGGEDFEISLEKIKIVEKVDNFMFRREKNKQYRKLNDPVLRWPHKERLDNTEPQGCGFPVCALMDSRPKRFKSMCHLIKWMHEEGKVRRVIEVQKGGCEDAIEEVGHDRPWASGEPSSCEDCLRHPGCGKEICINDNGHAKSFKCVCDAMKYLHNKVDKIKIAVGLGQCRDLYSSCMYTEWWDLDEPCSKGEVEAVILSHTYAKMLGAQGRHRSCSASQINYPAEFLTLEGQGKVTGEGNAYSMEKDRIVCLNKNNVAKPKPPYYWANKESTCRDWKMRYCCKNMWGEPVPIASLNISEAQRKIVSPSDVIVDPPIGKTLFDDCEWKSFMSQSYGKNGDLESRELLFKNNAADTCKQDRFSAYFIDSRTRDEDIPWDETGDIITKNTAIFGLYCEAKNNKVIGKVCHDYKIRLCCKKEVESQWGQWSDWSECTKTCGGGNRKRDRVCNKKEGHKEGCFMDGPNGDKRYKEQCEMCNPIPCPKDLQWQDWQAWSTCSATCDKGVRRRQRACFPPKNGGKDCPPPESKAYSESSECMERRCIDPQWIPWTSWTSCSVSCGLGTKIRRRHCVDVANGNRPIDTMSNLCLGPAIHQDDCDKGHCPVDGGWTAWQNWGECNIACGPDGKRPRQRYCTNPFPMHGGKSCPGNGEEKGPCLTLPPCPIHCLFSEWGSWSKCSASCGQSNGAGTRLRNRYIAIEAKHGGMKCVGATQEFAPCIHCETKPKGYDGPCIGFCPVDCVWSSWTSWTGSCRSCYNKGQEASVGLLARSRQRFVEVDEQYGGQSCHSRDGKKFKISDGLDIEQLKCRVDLDTPMCPAKAEESYWSSWGEWGDCDMVCAKQGKETRRRRCVQGLSGKHSVGCQGKESDHRDCLNPCPPDGWTEWDMWSPCKVTCGIGQSARRRTCRDDNRGDIPKEARTCKGIQREQRPCDSGSCSRYESFETNGKDVTGLVVGWKSANVQMNKIASKPDDGQESQKDGDANKDREKDGDKDREKDSNKDNEKDLNKDRENNANKDKDSNKDRENNANKDKDSNKDRENDTNKDKDVNKDREKEPNKEIDKEPPKDGDKDTNKEKEMEKGNQRDGNNGQDKEKESIKETKEMKFDESAPLKLKESSSKKEDSSPQKDSNKDYGLKEKKSEEYEEAEEKDREEKEKAKAKEEEEEEEEDDDEENEK